MILSSAGIDDSSRPWLLGIEWRDWDPGDLSRLYRAWVGPRLGHVDPTTPARLDGAVRAALDL